MEHEKCQCTADAAIAHLMRVSTSQREASWGSARSQLARRAVVPRIALAACPPVQRHTPAVARAPRHCARTHPRQHDLADRACDIHQLGCHLRRFVHRLLLLLIDHHARSTHFIRHRQSGFHSPPRQLHAAVPRLAVAAERAEVAEGPHGLAGHRALLAPPVPNRRQRVARVISRSGLSR